MRFSLFLLIIFTQYSCGGDTHVVSNNDYSPKLNIIVLLDLSDRILKPDQINRDIAILDNLYTLFLQRIQDQLYFKSKDKFRVVLSYQNNVFSNSKIFSIENDLYTNMELIHVTKKVNIKNSVADYKSKIRELYSLAKVSDDPNDYSGADIQGYLKNRLQDDLVLDSAINKLVIITDGYQYVQGVSKGLETWPPSTDLGNVEVFVVEMAPYDNRPSDNDLMHKYWTDWLTSMNAKKKDLIFQDALSQVNQRLSDGILGNGSKLHNPMDPIDASTNISSIGIEGTYSGIVNKKARSLQIIKTDEDGSSIYLICNYIPMGIQYQNLKGRFDKKNNLISIDALGTFSVVTNNGKYTLTSNSLRAEFVK